jgi:hypothetical protein
VVEVVVVAGCGERRTVVPVVLPLLAQQRSAVRAQDAPRPCGALVALRATPCLVHVAMVGRRPDRSVIRAIDLPVVRQGAVRSASSEIEHEAYQT